MHRRIFTNKLLKAISSFALIESLYTFDAISTHVKPITDHWAIRLNEYCSDLKKSTINPVEWQIHVESLFNKIELNELLKFIDFHQLVKGFEYPDLGVNTKYVKFPILEGLPENTIFFKKIFGMKKGRSIIPHGHSNMSSAHLLLTGEMHLRHYEKIDQTSDHLIIHPTVDRVMQLGDYSSISDEKDNIHWFIANSETAFTFDIIMLDLKGKPYDIHNIDILEKENLSDGNFRVPILDVETALKKYGKTDHH